MGPCVSAWVLNSLWLTGYGYLCPPHSENRWSSVFSILQSARLSTEVMRSHMNVYTSTNAVNVLTQVF